MILLAVIALVVVSMITTRTLERKDREIRLWKGKCLLLQANSENRNAVMDELSQPQDDQA